MKKLISMLLVALLAIDENGTFTTAEGETVATPIE